MSFKIGSLFDGSGGFPLAATMCGGIPVWASEIEPYPIAVTKSRFPNMKHLGSVTDVKGNEVKPVDVITFGSPCQDLSVAGKRAGLKHEDNGDEETTRSGLFMEAVRIIKEMRKATNGAYPRFAIWENVPGAFSSNKGEDFRTVCEELIKVVEPGATMPAVPKNGWPYADSYCGEGWSLSYRTYDAQYWGVPQRRRRIYLVADFGGECAGKISFEREGLRGYFAESGAPRQGAAADAQGCLGADDREGNCGGVNILTPWDSQGNQVADGTGRHIYPTVRGCGGAGYQQGYVLAPVGFDGYNGDLTGDVSATIGVNCGLSTGRNGVIQKICTFQNTGVGWCNESEVGATLRTPCGGDSTLANVVVSPVCCGVLASSAANAETTDGKISPCLMARAGTGGNQLPLVAIKDEVIPIHDQATRFSGKRGDKSDGKGNGFGVGEPGDPMNTPTSGDRHAVAYCTDVGWLNTVEGQAPTLLARQYKDPHLVCYGIDCRNMNEYPELYPTLQAKPNGGQSLNFSGAVRIRYIVRRLTPTECARLQGFADAWAVPESKENLTDDEYRFWLSVRNTHAAINGKAVKDYTKAQMLTWYNKLHTDSSEYKLWGNGIALPTALYVMQGIADVLNQ